MRFWVSGPRIGFFRPGVSFGSGYGRRPQRASYVRPQGVFLYVIESANNTVKVGFSSNPEARLATLQTGSGFPLSLAYVAACSSPEAVERRAHELLARHRLQGEWFDCTADAAVGALNMAAHQLGISFGQPGPVPIRRPVMSLGTYLGWALVACLAWLFLGHG